MAGAIALPAGINAASAATITIDAAKLEAIYNQPSANANGVGHVTINILSAVTIYNSAWLNISTDALLDAMFAAGPDNAASKIVDAFFVDSITSCGGPGANIVGCADRPGHDLVVKSSYAATDANEKDLGHELGHNLGLDHIAGTNTNLMNPVLSGSTVLIGTQWDIIKLSPLFQLDTNGDNDYFINIRPILIAASTPLPAAWGMMTIGLGVGGLVLRRRKARTSRSA